MRERQRERERERERKRKREKEKERARERVWQILNRATANRLLRESIQISVPSDRNSP